MSGASFVGGAVNLSLGRELLAGVRVLWGSEWVVDDILTGESE